MAGLNEREEACVELIMRGAYPVAHEEMLKLTDIERANVENSMTWDSFDGYEQYKKGLEDAPRHDSSLDEIANP